MPVYKTARFDVRPETLDECLAAVREFVDEIRATQPGTRLYVSMQDKVHPTRFSHFMIFEDAAAEEEHRSSEATKRFTSRLNPHVIGGVQFRDLVAAAST
jgi:quinol monooxygenase YgiN